MKSFLYKVFAASNAEIHNAGGKDFVLVPELLPETEMQAFAKKQKAAITIFLKNTQARFFTRLGKEKAESDSGALVVAHHLGKNCQVQMMAGNLNVELERGIAWTNQGDHHVFPLSGQTADWFNAFGIDLSALENMYLPMHAGNIEKQNFILPVNPEALDNLKPDMEVLVKTCAATSTNGAIAVAFSTARADIDFRFFAPHKNLPEDNAGSFSLASICGYLAAHRPSGLYEITAAQGYAMQCPSMLHAKFLARDSVALTTSVGGIVTLLGETISEEKYA